MVNESWFSALIPTAIGVMKIAIFAKPETVMGMLKTTIRLN
jgi:hypothetical protein